MKEQIVSFIHSQSPSAHKERVLNWYQHLPSESQKKILPQSISPEKAATVAGYTITTLEAIGAAAVVAGVGVGVYKIAHRIKHSGFNQRIDQMNPSEWGPDFRTVEQIKSDPFTAIRMVEDGKMFVYRSDFQQKRPASEDIEPWEGMVSQEFLQHIIDERQRAFEKKYFNDDLLRANNPFEALQPVVVGSESVGSEGGEARTIGAWVQNVWHKITEPLQSHLDTSPAVSIRLQHRAWGSWFTETFGSDPTGSYEDEIEEAFRNIGL